jgi:hypothetical protein|nr:hypothetical protein [Lactiplantibacillus plantarum]
MNSGMKELRRRLARDRNQCLMFELKSEAAGVQQAINELDDLIGDGDDD